MYDPGTNHLLALCSVSDIFELTSANGTSDSDGEVWKSSRAREGITTLGFVILSARDLLPVGRYNGSWKKQKSSTSISNSSDGSRSGGCSNGIFGSSERPETLAAINWSISN